MTDHALHALIARGRDAMRAADRRRAAGELPALVELTPEQDRIAEAEELSEVAINYLTRWPY